MEWMDNRLMAEVSDPAFKNSLLKMIEGRGASDRKNSANRDWLRLFHDTYAGDRPRR
jgi:hypothetical protein